MAAHDRVIATYKQAVRRTFSFLKQTERLDDLFAKSIPVGDSEGFLVPVCELHSADKGLIATLAQWREENTFAFPSQFPVTTAGTALWLRSKLLDVEDRILFLVVDRHGNRIGHLGLANAVNDQAAAEIDNVIRGVKSAQPGIMTKAMKALLNWAQENMAPRLIFLRVFSDNDNAIGFYHKLGFKDDRLLPLRQRKQGDTIIYDLVAEDDSAPPDKHFLRMTYEPSRTVNGSEMILTAGPSISVREASYALDAARYGWNRQWSGYIKRFEAAFADYVGTKHALSTSSGTGALHLALAALEIGPGDEVIVPDLTWVATANAVVYVGAKPVFADVEPESWCLDPDSLEAAITECTRAVIPVHLYGHPARMDRIMDIARKHRLYVIEDAAPAVGAEFRGRKTGTFGDFAAFSFQGAKLLVTGEGGMLVTDNDELYAKASDLWDQGRDPKRTFWINRTGFKYKMSNIQAAIGLGQLEHIDEMIEAKRRVFSWYVEGFQNIPQVRLNQELPWARSIYWMTSILLDEKAGITRGELREQLRKRNVDTRPVFPAISQYPIWQFPQRVQPIARRIGNQALNLPSGIRLKREQVDYICSCVKEILADAK